MSPSPGGVTSTPTPSPTWEDGRSLLALKGARRSSPARSCDDDQRNDHGGQSPATLRRTTPQQHPALSNGESSVGNGATLSSTIGTDRALIEVNVEPIDHHVPSPPPPPPHLAVGVHGHSHGGGGEDDDGDQVRKTRTSDTASISSAPVMTTLSAEARPSPSLLGTETHHEGATFTGSRRGHTLPLPPPRTTEAPVHHRRADTVPILSQAPPGPLPSHSRGTRPPLDTLGSTGASSIDRHAHAPIASTSLTNMDRRESRRASLLEPAFYSTSSASSPSLDDSAAAHPSANGVATTSFGRATIGKRTTEADLSRPSSAGSAFDNPSPRHRNDKKGKSRMKSDDPLQYSGWGSQFESADDPLDPLSQMFRTSRSREPSSNVSLATSRTTETATTAATTMTSASLDPSVQALLDAIDLGAARRLVQDLEAQLPVRTSTMGRSLPPASSAVTASTSVKFATVPSSSPPIAPPALVIHPPAKGTTRRLSLSAPRRPSLHGLDSMGKDSPRRRSFSVGKGFGRQPSTGLPTSTSGIIAPNLATPPATPQESNFAVAAGNNVEQRTIDERVAMGASGRIFEDQISKVQLQLSPATHRRAQNCVKYLSLRYRPLGAQHPLADDPPLPNLLAVSRWRLAKQQIESSQSVDGSVDGRRYRGSSGAFIDTSKKVPPYGKRRNEKPGVWEVYPDDILDYIKAGGKLEDPAKVDPEERSNRVSISMPPNSLHSRSLERQSMSLPFPGPSERTRLFTPDQGGSLTSMNRPSLSRVREDSYDSVRHAKVRSIDRFLGFGTPSDPIIAGSSVLPVSPPRTHPGRFAGSLKDDFTPGDDEDHTMMETHEALNGNRNANSYPSPHRSRLTSSITRRFEKMRGRGHAPSSSMNGLDWESSDGGFGPLQPPHRKGYYSADPSLPGTPEGSDHDLGLSTSAGAPMSSKRSLLPLANLNLSNSTWKKGTASLRRNRDRDGERRGKEPFPPLFQSQSRLRSNGTDSGHRSSGGDDSKAAWKKDSPLSRSRIASDGLRLYSSTSGLNLLDDERRRRKIFESYSEDDMEVLRNDSKEVLDVSEERFAQLMQLTKAAYSDLDQIESFISTVPLTIKINLDGLVRLSSQTLKKTGIQITAQAPRLPASVIQSIVRLDSIEVERGQDLTSVKVEGRPSTCEPLHGIKDGRPSHVRFASTGSTDSSESDSDSETTSSSSDDAGNRSDDERELDTVSTLPRRRKSSLPPNPSAPSLPPRAATDIVIAPFDPLSRIGRRRTRSATLAVPSSRTRVHPTFDPLIDLQTPVDPIKSLELALQKFEKTFKIMDDAAENALEEQRLLNVEIEELVLESRQVMKDYDSADHRFIQPLQEQVNRVLQLLDKPSSSYDGLWIALSIAVGVLLWLARFVAIVINCVRSVVKYPFLKVRRVVSPAP
ncbi:BZ3500_MvSof-1268-A1-R1_Chr7-1g09204 [Microbotryum saponariae]|uniref:BZ3500_MvSof-1268-A1-R1_Chr7-1g09204 protein n=1 Tax=Microbotryum saponariae TaxID=289078 RepID=A0A2X0KWE5_9BASI|nr:BZ3501_MvSof-1269-A2-R1_Chr7-1g08909 [Microbotryum saponariae]SDA02993.1 BZ3500_MvSof-1268-A1-R1_Chr7-1g09204 [Microbotryum saponariae]